MRVLFCLLIMNLFVSKAWGLTELTAQIGHQKQAYGQDRKSDIITKNYYWGTAFYFFKAFTAIDVYYTHQTQIDNGRNLNIHSGDSNLIIDSSLTRVKTRSYGVGIKQAFAESGALIRPVLSVGYARQVVQNFKKITLRDQTTNITSEYSLTPEKRRYSSIFTTFSIQFKLVPGMALQTSVQTVFQAFKLNRFDDNLKYLIGLTWFL